MSQRVKVDMLFATNTIKGNKYEYKAIEIISNALKRLDDRVISIMRNSLNLNDKKIE